MFLPHPDIAHVMANQTVPLPMPSSADTAPITAKWIVLVALWTLATFWRRKGPEDRESHRCSRDDCKRTQRDERHENDPSDTGPIAAQNP